MRSTAESRRYRSHRKTNGPTYSSSCKGRSKESRDCVADRLSRGGTVLFLAVKRWTMSGPARRHRNHRNLAARLMPATCETVVAAIRFFPMDFPRAVSRLARTAREIASIHRAYRVIHVRYRGRKVPVSHVHGCDACANLCPNKSRSRTAGQRPTFPPSPPGSFQLSSGIIPNWLRMITIPDNYLICRGTYCQARVAENGASKEVSLGIFPRNIFAKSSVLWSSAFLRVYLRILH